MKIFQQEVTSSRICLDVTVEIGDDLYDFNVTVSEDENVGWEDWEVECVDDNRNNLTDDQMDEAIEFIKQNLEI